jgi:Zn-dependent peptidase ImmA (M78 family)
MKLSQHIADRNLTAGDVARKTNLSLDRVEQIVAGDEPSLAEIKRISKAIHVPLGNLLSNAVDSPEHAPYRVLLRRTIDQRAENIQSSLEVVAAQISDIMGIARGLQASLEWLNIFRGLVVRVENAEDFAAVFRRAFAQLDDKEPFPFLPQTLEELGVLVCYGRDAKIDGVSAIIDGRAVILLGRRTSKPRMLFTLAHEVGHLVARHDLRDNDFAQIDQWVGEIESVQVKAEEQFADAFAAAVLMPRKGFLITVQHIRDHYKAHGPLGDVEIMTLARFFSVSFEVAARRCEAFGLLEPRGARALYQAIVAQHKNPERRADELGLRARDPIVIETSSTLLTEATRLVGQEKLSAGRAAEILNVPVSQLFVANVKPSA